MNAGEQGGSRELENREGKCVGSILGFAARGKGGNHMVTVTLAELTVQTGPLFTCPTADPTVNPAHR